MAPALVHLLGFPAVGKCTIAKELAAMWPAERGRMVVVDNHHINNVILGVLDVDGVTELPPRVFELARDVRSSVFMAIEELAPAQLSYVFTNVFFADNPRHSASLQRVADLAARRESHFVPVRLHCTPEEVARRAPGHDRRERMAATVLRHVESLE